MTADTFTAKVDDYLAAASHIGDNDPVAYGLRVAAAELDTKFVTSLWTEYNKTMKYLKDLEPVTPVAKPDPLLSPAPKKGA